MLCPGTNIDCDNPGCRRGGCQGRLPELPLFQAVRTAEPQPSPAPDPVVALRPRNDPADRLAA